MAELTLEEQKAIVQATEIQVMIDSLDMQVDALLTPVVTNAMANMELAELRLLVNLLPRGFHRSELQTYINRL